MRAVQLQRIADCGLRSEECGLCSYNGLRIAECGMRAVQLFHLKGDCNGLRIAECGMRAVQLQRIADCGVRNAGSATIPFERGLKQDMLKINPFRKEFLLLLFQKRPKIPFVQRLSVLSRIYRFF